MYKQRNTYWIRTLAQARPKRGGWLHTDNIYTAKTATQLCCDIRAGRRIKGIKPGEVWDAEWYRHDDNDDSMCSVMIRLVIPPVGSDEHTRYMCNAVSIREVWDAIAMVSNI